MSRPQPRWSARTVAAARRSRRARLESSSSVLGLDRVDVLRADGDRVVLRAVFVEGPSPDVRAGLVARVETWNVELSRAEGDGPAPLHLVSTGPDPDMPGDALRLVARPTSDDPARGTLCRMRIVDLDFVDPAFREVLFPLGDVSPSEAVFEVDPVVEPTPTIDYTSRDYGALRTALLDRMSVEVPEWTERHPADQGVMLVEVLAFVGDMLAYRQDAVGTEAYASRARVRPSLRRHARLLGHRPFDGLDARVMLWVEVDADIPELPDGQGRKQPAFPMRRGTPLLTEWIDQPVLVDPQRYWRALPRGVVVFESMIDRDLWPADNLRAVYTWGSSYYALGRGATAAALVLPDGEDGRDPPPERLRAGDLVMFCARQMVGESLRDARTYTVRLVADPVPVVDPLAPSVRLSMIAWHADDAMPTEVVVADEVGGRLVEDLCVVRGNVVLADHGRSRRDVAALAEGSMGRLRVPLGLPADLTPAESVQSVESDVAPFGAEGTTPLAQLTMVDPVDLSVGGSARALSTRDGALAMAAMALYEQIEGLPEGVLTPDTRMDVTDDRPAGHPPAQPWVQRVDLLSSRPFDRDYVVELETDGTAELRFGDGTFGRARSDRRYFARWREGVGRAGNIGAGTLRHVVTDLPGIRRIHNPTAAGGGRAAEPLEQIRATLTSTSAQPVRCLTVDEWTRAALQLDDVSMVAVDPRRSGSGDGVWLYLYRTAGRAVDDGFARRAVDRLQRYAVAGTEVVVTGPRWVPLDVELRIRVSPWVRAARARDTVARRIGAWLGRGSTDGDRVRFGETIYASGFIERAMEVDGVEQVEVLRLQRRSASIGGGGVAAAVAIDDFELATVGTRPAGTDPGRLVLQIEGGR